MSSKPKVCAEVILNPLVTRTRLPGEAVDDSVLNASAPVVEEEGLLDLGFVDDFVEPEPAIAELQPSQEARPRNAQERIRSLNAAGLQQLAKRGNQQERVMLERMYGKGVWDALLRNPKLTPPEAARIARMGALPLPLLEVIVNNRSWLSSPQVRRALLANPRLKRDMLNSVLRATPKNELKLMAKQMAYPLAVRQAAQKIMK